MYPEFKVPEAQWQDFLADRQGVVIGQKLAPALRLEDRRPHPAQGARLSGRQRLGIQRARHLPRHAAVGRRGPALAAARILLREGARVLEGHRGLVRRARRGPRAGGRRRRRRSTESSRTPRRDAHPDRVGIRVLVHEADGQHRVPDHGDRLDRVLHAAAGDRQHDGDRRSRAHSRAGRAEGGRLLGPVRARPGARRVAADRSHGRRARPVARLDRGRQGHHERDPADLPVGACRSQPAWQWRSRPDCWRACCRRSRRCACRWSTPSGGCELAIPSRTTC